MEILTSEKSVQYDHFSVGDDVNMADSVKKEKQEFPGNGADEMIKEGPKTNGHAPLPSIIQTDLESKDLQPQPLVKGILEEKHCFLDSLLTKRIQDDINMEILDFHSNKGSRANSSLLKNPASLVTFVKFQRGEFVEVKSSTTYNGSMCLKDMKNAITAALDACINQTNETPTVAPSPPQPSPRQDVSTSNNPENIPQGKSMTPPKSNPSKKPKAVEGNVGKSKNDKFKPKPEGRNSTLKVANTGTKSTQVASKSTPEDPKAEKQKKTPEKVKETPAARADELPEPQPTKEKVEPAPKPKPVKPPPPPKPKKIKIPDEESIKFANRQREIQRMKKELKERLKREGKEGVDPAARINAWGRTVGVTCTMCGNHVQKSYGCFRRDTAPEKLIHLFTPGMNRIKICRRCLPYKKLPGKGEHGEERALTKHGLKALAANKPLQVNPGTNTPRAPAPEKTVSTTTLSAIHRKVTAGQESTGNENVAQVNIPSDHVNTDLSQFNIDPVLLNIGSGHVNIPSVNVNIPTTHVNIPAGHLNIPSGHVIDGSGNNGLSLVNNAHVHVDPASVNVSTGSGHVNAESNPVTDGLPLCLPPEIDLGESGKGSAIEYIRKLALNLKANYNEQQGDVASKIVTPEEQIIKTPLYEQLAGFTPVTPSMNLGTQFAGPAAVNGPGATNVLTTQWKPVLSQPTPVTETKPSFGQGTEASVTSAPNPPWTTVPIVLKNQPPSSIVLTSPNQMPKSQTLQTFFTTANQKQLKLVPAIMVPSQNTLPRQGPLLLQIQRVKLVREKPADRPESDKDKLISELGKENEMVEPIKTGLEVSDVQSSGDDILMEDLGSRTNQLTPEEIASTEAEACTTSLQSLAVEVSGAVEDEHGNTQDIDVNTMDTIGHLEVVQDNVLQTEDTQEEVDLKLLESLNPSGPVEEQVSLPGSLGMNYPEQDPAAVFCVPAYNVTQVTTMYPTGYQVIGEKSNDQRGILETATDNLAESCVRNIFESQISEEYLPQAVCNDKQVDIESMNQINTLQQETVEEFIKDDELLEKTALSQGNEVPNDNEEQTSSGFLDVLSSEPKEGELEQVESEVQNDERIDKKSGTINDVPVEMESKKDVAESEERKEDVQNEKELSLKEKDEINEERKDGSYLSTQKKKNEEEEEVVSETENKKEVPEVKHVPEALLLDEDVPLDRRRSQRRTASPRKSPSKSPVKPERKVGPRVHGTRQSTQKQKDAGSHGTQKEKAGSQVAQKEKAQGSHKDEKQQEAMQGVKRKRPGRPRKTPKGEEDSGSSTENVKNIKQEMQLVKENRNSPSKRMKTRKDSTLFDV